MAPETAARLGTVMATVALLTGCGGSVLCGPCPGTRGD